MNCKPRPNTDERVTAQGRALNNDLSIARMGDYMQRKSHKIFRPWTRQQHAARLLLSAALALLAVSFVFQSHIQRFTWGIAAALTLGSVALQRKVAARRHGQNLESRYAPMAVRALEKAGVEACPNYRIGRADIDLLARKDGKTVTIEIKSFRNWRQRWRDRSREARARDQARAQQRRVGATACLIWLPEGKTSLLSWLLSLVFPERQPAVVKGPPKRLVKAVLRQLQ